MNSLPPALRSTSTLFTTFKKELKSFLFGLSFCLWQRTPFIDYVQRSSSSLYRTFRYRNCLHYITLHVCIYFIVLANFNHRMYTMYINVDYCWHWTGLMISLPSVSLSLSLCVFVCLWTFLQKLRTDLVLGPMLIVVDSELLPILSAIFHVDLGLPV